MCGVIGIFGAKNSAYEAYLGLQTLQHRGQDAAGILSYDFSSRQFYLEKRSGLVSQVFHQRDIARLSGSLSIAQTRYATIGSKDGKNFQPRVGGYPLGIGFVHNGSLSNYYELVEFLKENLQIHQLTSSDLEIFQSLFSIYLAKNLDKNSKKDLTLNQLIPGAKKIFEMARGGYSLVGSIADQGMFALRDPLGIRPLVLGERELKKEEYDPKLPKLKKSFCLSSESVTLSFLGYKTIRMVSPGEFLYINKCGEISSKILSHCSKKAPCMFEWVYFSDPESDIEGRSVYQTRLDLGYQLAKKVKKLQNRNLIKPDIVSSIPDTSRLASISLAEALGIPYREVLIRNRYIHRSFILGSQKERERAVALKLVPVKSAIQGKNILLVDDSIVRGTTSKKIIHILKERGAREVYMASTCPPVRYPCFYGIDFPEQGELLASNRSQEAIALEIGAKEVIYLDEEALLKALDRKQVCMACLNAKYPIKLSESLLFQKQRMFHRQEDLYKNSIDF